MMQDDIVERLRRIQRHKDNHTAFGIMPDRVYGEAADLIERQSATILSLREQLEKACGALEPFAFLEMERCEGLADTQYVWEAIYCDRVRDWFSFGDIEAARSTLQQIKDTPA